MYILKIEILCYFFCLSRIVVVVFFDYCVKLFENVIKLKNVG